MERLGPVPVTDESWWYSRTAVFSCLNDADWLAGERDHMQHTYVHTYIHTYIHVCMHTYIHTYIYVCMYACILQAKELSDNLPPAPAPTRAKKQREVLSSICISSRWSLAFVIHQLERLWPVPVTSGFCYQSNREAWASARGL
jgi:hypothetical protein